MKLKRRGVAAATTAALMLGFGSNAFADSTFDLVQALVNKGILTEEEALPLLKGRENDIKAADTKVAKKAKIGISEAIDNATLYGDIRVREEYRKGEDTANFEETRDRLRYKLTFGVKTNAGDFYSDLAFAMGAGGRSDNATFGNGNATAANQNGSNNKETLFVKRAMLGWHTTDWLDIEAGRIANPLYTTEMVWDKDLTFEGLAEKVTYPVGADTELFGNFAQSQYVGDRRQDTGTTNDRVTNFLLAFQGGAKYKFNDTVSAKAGLTFTKYTNDKQPTGAANVFRPALGTATGISPTLGTNIQATNDIRTLELPAEINFKTSATGDVGLKVFGDYVHNLDGSDRFDAAVAAAPAGATRTALQNAGNDDNAWLLGFGLENKQGKTPQKGDWSARLWYQDVGVYAVDPNAVDSDFFDSRVNMKGVVFKAEYNLRDNVYINAAAGHATRKNDDLAAVGTGNDVRVNLDKIDLYQVDLTYKF